MMRRIAISGLALAAALLAAAPLQATEPPQDKDLGHGGIGSRLKDFSTKRGLTRLTKIVQANRAAFKASRVTFLAASRQGGLQIKGRKAIPVLMAKYANSGADPYPVANLQQELFGTWPTGTMSDYYKEVSYGTFEVTGTVYPWKKLARNDKYYEGPDPAPDVRCNGMCAKSKLETFIEESVAANDTAVNFADYDNDGPDGQPNSGDDDGFVDFIALVHPETGGECSQSGNIWSHRYAYSELTGKAYATNDTGANGRKIQIDDYVIMPAMACDGRTMIEIGVFAHEFGHAFGLPDLYDTDDDNGKSSGIGGWGLMGSGSWGGDNVSPHRPSHMSVWEKEFLGWVTPALVAKDGAALKLAPIETRPEALKILISDDEYYLIENRNKTGFDDSLPGSGLLVWRVNPSIVATGMQNNSVNADALNPGISLIQADNLNQLATNQNRGDAGDLYRGSSDNKALDAASAPRSSGQIALCAIGDPGASQSVDVFVSKNRC